MPRIPPSRAGAGLFVALSLLLAVPGGSAERVGTVRWEGVKDKDRSLTKVESAILRQDPRAAAAVLSRTSVHLFVAEGRASWDRDVAPLLSDALQSGPQAVARLASAMPAGIATAGPNIDGGVVSFALPGKRGEGVMAIRFPDLLDRSRTDSEVVDSPWPNRGRFVAGVDVEADRDADIVGVYVPSRPKGLSRGAPPDVRPKELPRDGRGDLVIFRGKGASGDDAESLRRDLRDVLGASTVPMESLRSFPKGKDDLTRDLKTFRVEADTLETDGGWYEALARDPRDWDFASERVTHPVRYIAFSAPAAVEDSDGTVSTLILGGVALYTPVLLSASQAPLYLGVKPRTFYEAVHAGEVPFLREKGSMLFHRAWLDRWKGGGSRTPRGRTFGTKGTARRIEEIADEARSKGIGRAAGKVMPRRFEPAPDDAPSGSPPVRGRVFSDDLNPWLRHFDTRAEINGAKTSYALKRAAGGTRFEAGFGGGSGGGGPTRGPGLEIVDLYTLDPTCTQGQQVVGALGFVLDGVPDGEEATLLLQWSLSRDGRALVRFSAEIAREAGEHEVHVEAGCPSDRGTATFEVIASWVDKGIEQTRSTTVVSR